MAEQKKPLNPVWAAAKPFVNGGASGMISTVIIQPIDMVKASWCGAWAAAARRGRRASRRERTAPFLGQLPGDAVRRCRAGAQDCGSTLATPPGPPAGHSPSCADANTMHQAPPHHHPPPPPSAFDPQVRIQLGEKGNPFSIATRMIQNQVRAHGLGVGRALAVRQAREGSARRARRCHLLPSDAAGCWSNRTGNRPLLLAAHQWPHRPDPPAGPPAAGRGLPVQGPVCWPAAPGHLHHRPPGHLQQHLRDGQAVERQQGAPRPSPPVAARPRSAQRSARRAMRTRHASGSAAFPAPPAVHTERRQRRAHSIALIPATPSPLPPCSPCRCGRRRSAA